VKTEEIIQLVEEITNLLVDWNWFDWIYEKNEEDFRSFESYVLNHWSMSSLRNDIKRLTVIKKWLDSDKELFSVRFKMIEDCIRRVLLKQYYDYRKEYNLLTQDEIIKESSRKQK
jgi:hypothetical protein